MNAPASESRGGSDGAARIGVAFSRGLAPAEVVECVKLAEALGYESAWMAEGHAGDQFAILGACAVATARIRLGTSISSVFVRSAPTIAMAAATVDHLSGGRFILGLGTSHRVQVEPEHGVPFTRPTDRLRDTVEIVRALSREGVVAHAGRVLSIERFDLWFQPLRREIPIYIAGLFPPMLELCGEIAQGAMLTWPTLDAPGRAAQHVGRGAARAGRDPREIDVASLIPCAVAASRQDALDGLRPGIAFYAGFFPRYNRLLAESGFAEAVRVVKQAWDRGDQDGATRAVPDELIDAVAIAGTAEDCRERVQAYRRAGLQLPIISGRMKPSTKYSQIADANAQATCVPSPSARARRYIRTHQRITDVVRKNPAISHQPPLLRGGMCSPYSGAGGSSASQKSCRTNWTGSQLTDAHMLSPMISNARKPQMSDIRPSEPR